jgi:O-acetylhomoserine/O-acetylserine sulfhydrylase-like pyridoxal-dependent enzyme
MLAAVTPRRFLITAACIAPLVLVACGDDANETAEAGDEFCTLSATANEASDAFGTAFETGDGAALEAAGQAAVTAGEAAVAKAPEDIVATARTASESLTALIDVLKKNGYDLEAVAADPDFTAVSGNESYAEAQTKLDAYLDEKCGATTG